MHKIEHERGFLILAHSNSKTDYRACARALAKSLRYHMPDCKICLVTDKDEDDSVFDIVKPFPFGDLAPDSDWKLANDYQCFAASPFRQTIKIEADILVTTPIDHWWHWFEHRDVVISTGVRNYLNEPSTFRGYRGLFDENDLPDVYNAITYWRLSQLASDFWVLVGQLFEHWADVRKMLKYCDTVPPNTDMIYAIAAKYLGIENVTLPHAWPNMIHLKSALNFITSEHRYWHDEYTYEFINGGLRLNTVQQVWPCHYFDKNFAHQAEEYYDKLLASS